jgi:site-specific recombinase XerD
MADREINQFLTHLAVERKVAASTQNQAFSALLFLFTQVLKREIKVDAVRARTPERVPVVLSIDEVRRVLNEHPRRENIRKPGVRWSGSICFRRSR